MGGGRRCLSYDYLFDFLTLTTDVEAGGGGVDTHTLKVELLDGGVVVVGCDVGYAGEGVAEAALRVRDAEGVEADGTRD